MEIFRQRETLLFASHSKKSRASWNLLQQAVKSDLLTSYLRLMLPFSEPVSSVGGNRPDSANQANKKKFENSIRIGWRRGSDRHTKKFSTFVITASEFTQYRHHSDPPYFKMISRELRKRKTKEKTIIYRMLIFFH